MTDREELIEKLAALEHEQWVGWSKAIRQEESITLSRVNRWKELWCDYEELPEDVKEQDREYARKVIEVLEEEGVL